MISSAQTNVSEFGFIPGQRVADFGSGAGHYALALSQVLGSLGRVYAIDLQESALTRLAKLVEEESQNNISFILGDIEKDNGTLLKDSYVDGVVFSNIFIHLEDKKGALKEAKRILKPGGKICIVDWQDDSPLALVREKKKKDLLDEGQTRELLESLGFTLIRTFNAGEHHYGLIFKK